MSRKSPTCRNEWKHANTCRVLASQATHVRYWYEPCLMTLSKKRSQEKSYEVRGQSDVCHTSVMFTPAFPWHQMGGEFSHRLVSTLSYILYTCLCQEFSKWFIFFLNFPVCMCYLQLCVPTHVNNFNKSHELQFVQVC